MKPYFFQFAKQDGAYFRSKSYQWVYIYEKGKQIFHYDRDPSNAVSPTIYYSPIRLISKADRFVYTGFHPKTLFAYPHTYSKQHAIKHILINGLKHRDGAMEYIREDLRAGKLFEYVKTMVVVAYPELSTLDLNSDWLGTFDHQLPPSRMKAFLDVKRKDGSTFYRAYAVLYSDQELETDKCKKNCKNGMCLYFPRSNDIECHCPLDFAGSKCDQKSKNDLRKSFGKILDEALKLPSMSDVYYTLINNHNETKALIITENEKGMYIIYSDFLIYIFFTYIFIYTTHYSILLYIYIHTYKCRIRVLRYMDSF